MLLGLAWLALRVSIEFFSSPGRQFAVTLAEREAIIQAWRAAHFARRSQEALATLQSIRDWAGGARQADRETATTALQTAEKSAAEALTAFKDAPTKSQTHAGCGVQRTQAEAARRTSRYREAEQAVDDARSLEEPAMERLRIALRNERNRGDAAATAELKLVAAQRAAQEDLAGRDPLWWTKNDAWMVRTTLRALAVGFAMAAGLATGEEWLLWLVLAAAVIALATLGIAQATSDTRFFWTGVALFVGALLFASLFTLLRTAYSPKVQPVGILIDKGADQCPRFISGTFVARTGDGKDDRLYYGQSGQLDGEMSGGRMMSLPNERILAYGVGKLVEPDTQASMEMERLIELDLLDQTVEGDAPRDCASRAPP